MMKALVKFVIIGVITVFGTSACTNYDATVGLMNAVGIDSVKPREKDPVDIWLEHSYKQEQDKNTVLHGAVKVRD